MDKATLQKKIEEAVAASEKWAQTGWPMTFGNRATAVNSLAEAQKLDKKFVFRLEAIAHWELVKQSGEDAARWGKRALASLSKGDLHDVADSLYFAMITEKFLRESVPTWGELARQSKQAA